MRDVIWTIITVWLIWRIWSLFKGQSNVYIQKNERHFHYHDSSPGQTGNTSSKEKKIQDNEGEYVDFEEFKK